MNWPVLKSYDQEHLDRIAMPIGGIGTGTISLGGRGDLRDWELMNRPAKGFIPTFPRIRRGPQRLGPFFALYAKSTSGEAVARALEGPLLTEDYEGEFGAPVPNHGLPRFRNCRFDAAYPLGQVILGDPAVPLAVRIEAFNPMIPGDVEKSGLPVAVIRFVLTNRTSRFVAAAVCGSIPNFIGSKSSETGNSAEEPTVGRNRFRKGRLIQGLVLDAPTVDSRSESWGTLALTTTADDEVSHRTSWLEAKWNGSLLDFWDDFSEDGRLTKTRASNKRQPIGSLAARVRVPPRAERTVTFLVTWHFPNRFAWAPQPDKAVCCESPSDGSGDPDAKVGVGNWYCTRFRDAWDAASKIAPMLPSLERTTVSFVKAFCASDLPTAVKEAALFNLSTLRTETCFRTREGHFFAWEGCRDDEGCCNGSCTHVWNYEHATAHLFGDLSRSMRATEFLHATDDEGKMAFRVELPLPERQSEGPAAADGQMGCLLKLYRDWQLCGDDDLLKALWPDARRSLEFCWVKGGWDADCDGIMEGCQHNTMDVEYYGPNPQMMGWYLGALRAAEEMARYLGETLFADKCRYLFENGSRWMDDFLFNGEYYEQHVMAPRRQSDIHPALRLGTGSRKLKNPDLQLGAGCLVDQLVGQYTAHVCGLGYLHRKGHVLKTLRSIARYNKRSEFSSHFNNMRSYALGDETALLMATYPRGKRPQFPFPYFSEVMTGFEYTAAVGMLYEGLTEQGLKVISAIRERYDGKKRNPFDEAECGHHYGRAMASWAAVLALTGFRYSAVSGVMRFACSKTPSQWFWSNGYAWGTFSQKQSVRGVAVDLKVFYGSLQLANLILDGVGQITFSKHRILRSGRGLTGVIN
jgi:non-lysosomal glucosylceramidase